MPNVLKTFQEYEYDENKFKGHPRSSKTIFMPNQSSTFVFGLIMMKICMNANIT